MSIIIGAAILAILIGWVAMVAATNWRQHAAARLTHEREMTKLREQSDQAAHRRWVESRELEDRLALPEGQRQIKLEAALASARSAEADSTKRLEEYHERERHRRY